MSDEVKKFIKNQEDAVQLARDVADTPSDYNIRVDAINAALSLRRSADYTWSLQALIGTAAAIETYLKNGATK